MAAKESVTIVDIAREAGTSISTVSYVLNGGPKPVSEKTRRKILDVIERHSYSPDRIASSLKRKRTMSLGVVFPVMTNIYFPETLGGILEVTQHENYNIILKDASGDAELQEDCIQDLVSARVDGLIIRPIARSRIPDGLRDSGIPLVVVDRMDDEWREQNNISFDNRKAIKTATEILIDSGHRELGLITGPKGTTASLERVKGFEEAITENGLDLEKCFILWGDYSVENGQKSTNRILREKPNITGVVTASTRITFGAIRTINEHARVVPDDLSLVAFGYSRWLSLLYPPITTIEQPVREMGRRAVKMVLQLIEEQGGGDRREEFTDAVRIDGISHLRQI